MLTDQLSITFAALADPTRRSILTRLAEGEATVNELAEPFSVSLPAISRHLKVLERAGLIVRGRAAQWRPSRLQAIRLMRRWSGCCRERRRGRHGWTDSRHTCAEQENSMNDPMPVAAAGQQVLITRIFEAPRERVYGAGPTPTRWRRGTAPSTSTPRASGSISTCVSAGATNSPWFTAMAVPSSRSAMRSSSSWSRS